MNKKNNKETNKHLEKAKQVNLQKQTLNNEKKEIDLKQQLTSLLKSSLEKDAIIHEKEQLINDLKAKINAINEEYKQQICAKMQEANNLLAQKTNELEAKYHKTLNDAKKYAIKDQAINLVNIINQFEIACNYKLNDEKLVNYQKGFKIFLSMFNKLLSDLNITTIKPNVGQEFEPNKMECLETTNNPTFANNIITEVINVGYMLHDNVLKPALVKVNKK